MTPPSEPPDGQPPVDDPGGSTPVVLDPRGPNPSVLLPGDPTLAETFAVSGLVRWIGRFEVRAVLGQGAFGTVYRAYDPQLDREVAIKVPRFPPDRPVLVERFLREARSAARLRHPGIVATFEVGTASGEQFIVNELVTGQTLRERIDSGMPPTVRQVVGWVRDLAMALAYAHGQGIIHRDIKPTNIMIDSHSRAQLMDFGLAKRLDLVRSMPLVEDDAPTDSTEGRDSSDAQVPADITVAESYVLQAATNAPSDTQLTADGTVLGTPAYMSPEQAAGVPEVVGPLSDQYSLAVVLYELLTRHLPFEGPVLEILRQVAAPDCKPRSPYALNASVGLPLAAVCLRALSKQPAQRYESAADLAVDLQRWLNDQPVSALFGDSLAGITARRDAPPVRDGRLAEWCEAHPGMVVLLVLGLALLGFWGIGESWYVVSARREAETLREELAQSRQETTIARGEAEVADVVRCDRYRERGRGKDAKSLRYLVESFALAMELEDTSRQQVTTEILAELDELPRPSGLDDDAGLRWDLAVALLLGRLLPELGAWETLGKRLSHVGPTGDSLGAVDEESPFVPSGTFLDVAALRRGGQVLTSGADGWKLWDGHTRRRAGLPLERLGKLQSIQFRLPDHRQFLTIADDGEVRRWPNPVIRNTDRAAALRQWAQVVTGFAINAAGELQTLKPAQQEECRRRFEKLAGLRSPPTDEIASVEPKGGETPAVQAGSASPPISNSIGMKFSLIPPGEFTMGSPNSEVFDHPYQDYDQARERPQHRVAITKPFYLGVYEVTQAEYSQVMGNNPSHFSATGVEKKSVRGVDTSRFPVETVSWNEAVDFCQRLTKLALEEEAGRVYRLPTEAEWEYACRAGTTTPFHYGNAVVGGREANVKREFRYGHFMRRQFRARTTEVGSYAPNDFGLFDMHGNVLEWCRDVFDETAYRRRIGKTFDPVSLSESQGSGSVPNVARGGSWYHDSGFSRAAVRDDSRHDNWHPALGFRVACELDGMKSR